FRFEDRFQDKLGCGLHHAVSYRRNAEWAFTATGFRNQHPTHRRRADTSAPAAPFSAPPTILPPRAPRCARSFPRLPRVPRVAHGTIGRRGEERLHDAPCRTADRTGTAVPLSL